MPGLVRRWRVTGQKTDALLAICIQGKKQCFDLRGEMVMAARNDVKVDTNFTSFVRRSNQCFEWPCHSTAQGACALYKKRPNGGASHPFFHLLIIKVGHGAFHQLFVGSSYEPMQCPVVIFPANLAGSENAEHIAGRVGLISCSERSCSDKSFSRSRKSSKYLSACILSKT